MMVADVLVRNKHQAISNHHADMIMILVLHESYHIQGSKYPTAWRGK